MAAVRGPYGGLTALQYERRRTVGIVVGLLGLLAAGCGVAGILLQNRSWAGGSARAVTLAGVFVKAVTLAGLAALAGGTIYVVRWSPQRALRIEDAERVTRVRLTGRPNGAFLESERAHTRLRVNEWPHRPQINQAIGAYVTQRLGNLPDQMRYGPYEERTARQTLADPVTVPIDTAAWSDHERFTAYLVGLVNDPTVRVEQERRLLAELERIEMSALRQAIAAPGSNLQQIWEGNVDRVDHRLATPPTCVSPEALAAYFQAQRLRAIPLLLAAHAARPPTTFDAWDAAARFTAHLLQPLAQPEVSAREGTRLLAQLRVLQTAQLRSDLDTGPWSRHRWLDAWDHQVWHLQRRGEAWSGAVFGEEALRHHQSQWLTYIVAEILAHMRNALPARSRTLEDNAAGDGPATTWAGWADDVGFLGWGIHQQPLVAQAGRDAYDREVAAILVEAIEPRRQLEFQRDLVDPALGQREAWRNSGGPAPITGLLRRPQHPAVVRYFDSVPARTLPVMLALPDVPPGTLVERRRWLKFKIELGDAVAGTPHATAAFFATQLNLIRHQYAIPAEGRHPEQLLTFLKEFHGPELATLSANHGPSFLRDIWRALCPDRTILMELLTRPEVWPGGRFARIGNLIRAELPAPAPPQG